MLFGIAYRILGNAADAEDVLQDTWVRWQLCDRSAVREPAAFLATTATRLAINVLNSAHMRRETYIGPWLPSPVDTTSDPTLGAERGEALELATLLLMERLTPTERAAYVLREAFVYPYSRIAEVVETSEAGARQLVSRARKHLAGGSRRSASRETQRRFFRAFLEAARAGDTAALEDLLAVDAVSYTDGGGVVRRTARRPIRTRATLVRFLFGAAQRFWDDVTVRPVRANGREGALLLREGCVFALLTVTVEADHVSQIMWVMNPAKLVGVVPELVESRELVGASA
jgi:RNA polymerase sigma-70 factor (ECF subfamily)